MFALPGPWRSEGLAVDDTTDRRENRPAPQIRRLARGSVVFSLLGLADPDTGVLISHGEDMEAARQLHDVGGLNGMAALIQMSALRLPRFSLISRKA